MGASMNHAMEGAGSSLSSLGGTRKRDTTFWWVFLIGLLSLLNLCAPDGAAQTTSSVEGVVSDNTGLPIVGARVRINNGAMAIERVASTNSQGAYHLVGLPAASYNMTVSGPGFATASLSNLDITLNRTLTLNVTLGVATVEQKLDVTAQAPLLETSTSSSGSTIVPQQIVEMPINGRNYLDLMQLVPGVAVNRQADQGSDEAVPVLGERGGNTKFLIDGFGNTDEAGGGPASQFNQETIAEFQVITSGYKAEFGHASGGVVNVITHSGSNDWHGVASVFHRNSVLDSSNTPAGEGNPGVPFLLRWDPSLTLGGPIRKDRIFFFGSIERITENRHLNFIFPANTPDFIQQREDSFDQNNTTRETRGFFKLDEQVGRHHFAEQINLSNSHIANFLPLSQQTNLPSTRLNFGSRHLFLGFSDTVLLGNQSSPFLLTLRGQYRGEPLSSSPAHPEAGVATQFFIFSGYTTGTTFGDLGNVTFGADETPWSIDQKYGSFSANLAKDVGRHNLKFGYDYVRTNVDGIEANGVFNELWATIPDFETFGPVNAGLNLNEKIGGATPADNRIRLRNNYSGLFFQDDWKLFRTLTLNLGVRWDYDSQFRTKNDFSPRVGFAWQARPKTVVRGNFGLFYDHFRLAIARDIPQFGGANITSQLPIGAPRLFYGAPTNVLPITGICADPVLTDAQIAAMGATCPFPGLPPAYYGVDHLNHVVASGHAPIPDNVPVNLANVQTLSGLTPQQFADQASAAIAQSPGFFFWGPVGTLSYAALGPGGAFPVTVDPRFATPYTQSYSIGVQQQLGDDWSAAADYIHKDIRNILGIRQTNLPFDARLPGMAFGLSAAVNGWGPWFSGTYDAGILTLSKRISHRFALGGSYTYTNETDNALCENLFTNIVSITAGGACYPDDSFIGVPPVVTDPVSGKTNAQNSFVAANGNPVPKAGVFYYGPNLDKGPSAFALKHTLEAHGQVRAFWGVEFSSLFRIQSGFHYSRLLTDLLDVDGNQSFPGIDFVAGRNHFTAPRFENLDLRISKRFVIRERFKAQVLFEFFNLLNAANPAAIQANTNIVNSPFGSPTEVLPGREGQVGIRLDF